MRLVLLSLLLICISLPPCLAIGTGVYDVSSYGAKGDGVADDTAAIQKAIDDAAKSGGVAQLGAGRYRITGSLRIDFSDVRLRGLGVAMTRIVADGVDFHAVIVGNDGKEVQHVGISDFSVERPKQANPDIANVFLARTRYSSVDNMRIDNGGDGILVGSRTSPDISGCISIMRIWMGACRRCLVVACAADVTVNHMYAGFTEIGVYLTGGANNVRLTDSVFLTARPTQGKHGLVSDAGFMQEVKSCVFEETSEEVIKVTGIARFYFHDNWLNANPEFPMIRFDRVTTFSLRNTRFGGSGTSCVELGSCSRGDVTGNSMESSRGIGIIVKGGDNLEIVENQMNGNDKEGIRIQDGAGSVRLSGNHTHGGECAIHLTANAGDKFIIKENFLTHGKGGKHILDESKARTKIISDNIEE